jgi:taurine transport system ATP-binding protein
MPTLNIKDLTLNYAIKGGTLQALAPVNMTMHDGDFVVALGASGCGKTTLLNCIAGFLPPSSGEILLDGQPVVGPGADRGVVFQKHALMPWLNVLDNVALGLRLSGVNSATRNRIAMEKLGLVGLEAYAERAVYELSGGMRKRAGFARALVLDPDIVLFDEPDSGLDPVRTALLCELIQEIHAENGGAYVVITHDIASARRVAEYIAVLWRGQIVESGPATELFESDNAFVRQFLSGESRGPLGME